MARGKDGGVRDDHREGRDRNGGSGARSREATLDHVRVMLYEQIVDAVQDIADLESKWTKEEMIKRIVGYISNAAWKTANDESVSWDAFVTSFVESAMGSFGASCQERPWFFELYIGDILGHVAWEMLQTRRTLPVDLRSVCELAQDEYQSWIDQMLQQKAMWVAVEETFADHVIRGKVYNAVSRTYKSALEFVLADSRPLDVLPRLENFVKKWMDEALARCWSALQGLSAEHSLTEDVATALFKKLVVPFGEENPFSCLPGILLDSIGRPPLNWGFIKKTVRVIFTQWHSQLHSAPASKKRRKGGGGDDHEEPADAFRSNGSRQSVEEACEVRRLRSLAEVSRPRAEASRPHHRVPPPRTEQVEEEAPSPDGGGHPFCTSAEDCLGNERELLIRHIVRGDRGDLYCKQCWACFLESNPDLQGEPESV